MLTDSAASVTALAAVPTVVMPSRSRPGIDPDFPAATQAGQTTAFLQEVFDVYRASHLATVTSASDKHVLSRAHTRIGDLIEATVRLPVTNTWETQHRKLLDALRSLYIRLSQLIDEAKDTTVTGYLTPLARVAPRKRFHPDGTPKRAGGRPRKEVALSTIQDHKANRFGTNLSAQMLSSLPGRETISSRTFRRRVQEANEVQPWAPFIDYTPISDEAIRNKVEALMMTQSDCGITMMDGHFVSDDIHVKRSRLVKIMTEVRPIRNTLHKKIYRRREKYWCAGPNSVWHHDGQHGLINFGIVITAFIDGFSRTITCIQASTNNEASTMLAVFLKGTKVYGTPSRVRGDRGGENVEVARYMFRVRGTGRGSYLWGWSVSVLLLTRFRQTSVHRVESAKHTCSFI